MFLPSRRELALQLVDEVIDRPAIEALPALASLVEVEDRQPRPFEKREHAAARRDVVECEPTPFSASSFSSQRILSSPVKPGRRDRPS